MTYANTPRFNTRRVVIAIAIVAMGLTSCDRGPAQADLPALPTPYVDDALPVVRSQIERALQEAIDHPMRAQANGKLAMTLHAYLYYEAALAAYERTRLLAPKESRWAYLHGSVLTNFGQTGAATDAYRTAVALDSDNIAARLALAKNLGIDGQVAQARRALEELVAARPESVEAHYELGALLTGTGEPAAALPHLLRALELGGPFDTGYYALANAYRALGQDRDAARALAAYSRYRDVNLRLADPHMAAVQALDQSNKTLIARAQARYADGRVQEAIALLEQAIRNDDHDVVAHGTLIALYGETGQFEKVDEQYRVALAIDPDLAELHYNLGLARSHEKRNVEAIAAFERALELDPYSPHTHTRIGLVYREQGRNDKAVDAFGAALAVAPDYVPARRLLADLYFADQRMDEAGAQLARLADIPGERTPALLRRLALCYQQSGKHELARGALQDALELVDRTRDRSLATAIERDLARVIEASHDKSSEPQS